MNDSITSPGGAPDDLCLVGALLAAAPPPSPEVATTARARLMNAAMAQAAHSAGRGRLPAGSRAGRAVASVALAAAAALAVVMLVPGTSRNNGPAGGATGPGRTVQNHSGSGAPLAGQPAHAFLLSMASRVLSQPTGRYWCTDETDGNLELVGRADRLLTPPGSSFFGTVSRSAPAGFQYSIVVTSRENRCLGPNGTRFAWGLTQHLGAAPASPADAVTWRKDGSPTRWKAWYADQYISAKRGPVTQLPPGGKGLIAEPWGSDAALPASPARLRSVLLSAIPGPDDRAIRSFERFTGRTYQQLAAEQLMSFTIRVMQDPVRPAVRAAAYQVLASIPGMRMRPSVKDPDGRNGTALWLDVSADKNGPIPATGEAGHRAASTILTQSTGAGMQVVIVDPVTGYLLASETITTRKTDGLPSGTRMLYSVYAYRWTGKLPAG